MKKVISAHCSERRNNEPAYLGKWRIAIHPLHQKETEGLRVAAQERDWNCAVAPLRSRGVPGAVIRSRGVTGAGAGAGTEIMQMSPGAAGAPNFTHEDAAPQNHHEDAHYHEQAPQNYHEHHQAPPRARPPAFPPPR